MPISSQQQLLNAILQADREAAKSILEDWANQFGYERAVHEVLEPTLEQIGILWETGANISLAQAYVAGKISEDFITQVNTMSPGQATALPVKGIIVIGNIEEDFHSLGRKMVSIFLRSTGWQVYDRW